MTPKTRFPRFEDLPEEIPIFPLESVLLLPGGQLPLNVFEERYIAMVDSALQSTRLIGMVQPRSESCDGVGGESVPDSIFDIGCAGRITSFDETDDGRYLITLTGVCRFRIAKELSGAAGFRRVVPDWSDFRCDFDEAEASALDRERLSRVLRSYFDQHGISANWQAIEDTGDDRLITSLSMICPLEGPEKQALLEVDTVEERGAMLISLLEMAVLSGDDEDTSRH